MMRPKHVALALAFTSALVASPARADDVLAISDVKLDPPTLHSLGVQVLISGDDNRNASISVRVRKTGAAAWRKGYPLLRVLPETVTGLSVPQQFGGSVFDLSPQTSYDIELHAVDPDGSVDVTKVVTATTKSMPHDPKTARDVNVTDAASLKAALAAAKAGDVIHVAKGTYPGAFTLGASGTPDDPIVIRGEDEEGTIFDTDASVNNWEIYGGYVHLENMTIQGGGHAVRFFASSAKSGIVARRLHIKKVYQGIWITGDDTNLDYPNDVYVCDNTIEGLDVWPWVYDADATSHWDDEAIKVQADGVDACHNKIVGFGDTIIQKKLGARSYDFYGNDIYDSFDGTELEEGAGNARLFNNRWTNVWDGMSMQPIYGGPAYILRNVIYNAVTEQMKLHAELDPSGKEKDPSGILVFHNTFVSPLIALTDETPATLHNFVMNNNLFVGPAKLAAARAVEYTTPIDHGTFDYDGYYPDGTFWFGDIGGKHVLYDNFAGVKAGGVFEAHGVLLDDKLFANGQVGPADPKQHYGAFDATLAPSSMALDRGVVLPGLDEGFGGSAPDLGALELGCAAPVYGPRPIGTEENEAPIDCTITPAAADAGISVDAGGSPEAGPGGAPPNDNGAPSDGTAAPGSSGNSSSSGCGCRSTQGSSAVFPLGALVALAFVGRLRRARRRAPTSGD